MIKVMKSAKAYILFSILATGCSQVVEPVLLPNMSPDKTLQEEILIKQSPLTFDIAKTLNAQTYARMVSLPGNAFSADVVSEDRIADNTHPEDSVEFLYKLGIGDEIQLIQYVKQNQSNEPVPPLLNSPTGQTSPFQSLGPAVQPRNFPNSQSNIVTTSGRIGTDGSLLLLDIGRLEAKGLQLSQLRNEVRNILIRNGKTPNFQLEIVNFNSQRIYVTKDTPSVDNVDASKNVIAITDKGLILREILAAAGVAFNEKVFTLITLHRNGQRYSFSLKSLFSERSQDIYLQHNDHIFIKSLSYVDGKVYLVGGVKPKITFITPEKRQTLAEVLFADGGPMATQTAQRSAVYLLRGSNPMKAYHLDVQNPARIVVADSVELRPNDIVFVAEQPVSTFNRVLATILPLRILYRDSESGNLP